MPATQLTPQQQTAAATLWWPTAILVASLHLLLALVTQFENALLTPPAVTAGGSILTVLPFLQLGNLAAGLLIFGLGLLLLRATWSRGLLFVIVTLANVFLIVDQVAYPYFFDHLRCSAIEESASSLLWLGDSFVSMLNVRSGLNAGLLLLVSIGIYLCLFTERLSVWTLSITRAWLVIRKSLLFWILLVVYLVLSARLGYSISPASLKQHPLLTFAGDCLFVERSGAAVAVEPVTDLRRLRYGKEKPAPVESLTMVSEVALEHQKQGAANGEPVSTAAQELPNVILIVLESIGAKQLLPTGRPDPRITPFLAGLAQRSLTFDAIYTPYPATIVSNIAISTGGSSLTWGKVAALKKRYLGPTLAGEFHRRGYRTGLFSGAELDFGNLGDFFAGLEFDRLFDFGSEAAGFRYLNKADSWGADDADVLRMTNLWAAEQAKSGQPFYLRIQTNLAHHPYSVPDGYTGPVLAPSTDRDKYQNSLHYLDSLLARFYQDLESAGLFKNTIVAITGDHGEAFGLWHPTNFLHRNFLYDENVRSFLIISNPADGRLQGLSHVPAGAGEIMPTLLGLAGLAVPESVPGQDLLAENFQHRIQFFHKNNHPEQWGLRDGQWKYIATFSGDQTELYDLESDPNEQRNVADRYPDRVTEYARLCAAWYIEQNQIFMSHLEGWTPVSRNDYSVEDIQQPGPKVLAIGYMQSVASGEPFVEAPVLNPNEAIFAWIQWINYREDVEIEYRWIAPDGQVFSQSETPSPDDVITRVRMRHGAPHQEGDWRLELKRGDEVLLSGQFQVAASAPIRDLSRVSVRSDAIQAYSLNPASGNRQLHEPGAAIPRDRPFLLRFEWLPGLEDRIVSFKWRSPKGRLLQHSIKVVAGQRFSEVRHKGPYPLAVGTWWLTIWDSQRQIGSKLFKVAISD